MDRHIKDYFCQFSQEYPEGSFHKVIALHDAPDGDFDFFTKVVEPQGVGWIELAQLPTSERVEFVREFWLGKMADYPRLGHFLIDFFVELDDIGIFLTQFRSGDPWKCHMIYSFPGDSGYFRGELPATEGQLLKIQNHFEQWVLPSDYLAFLQIHNGFAKTTDSTGITSSEQLISKYEKFQLFLEERGSLMTSKGQLIDPKSLLPFYESFGMPFYQCFWANWHPESEAGNVYYSGVTNTIMVPGKEEGEADTMAFPTFSDWLMFYLERIG